MDLNQPHTAATGRAPRSTDTVYARLKQQILDNRYPPGAQILEGEIAAELNASRTPVREAFVRMAHADPEHYVVLDARAPIETIAATIRERVEPLLSQAVRR